MSYESCNLLSAIQNFQQYFRFMIDFRSGNYRVIYDDGAEYLL